MSGRRIKKFYVRVEVAEADGVHVVRLDGREAQTPAKAALAAPSRALALAIAEEWEGKDGAVDFDAMMLTRLASTAIDLGPSQQGRWAEDILTYLKSDLLSYRADEPAALMERQRATWSPFTAWLKGALGEELRVTAGVVAVEQAPALIEAARARLAAMDVWRLIAVKTAAELTGSAVLALALEARAFPPTDIFAASRLDERFQGERWGVDEEAAAREARLEADFIKTARWLALLDA
ncbi:MAG TPA: ATP12 family protein [Parvularculaceae bacterium]|nr:ATP12 family protein [Parvularculaceae bacterium]